MAKPSAPPGKNVITDAVRKELNSHRGEVTVGVQTQVYQGAIPHPDILRGFDDLVPGTAERLIDLAHSESLHRRQLEIMAIEANVTAQHKQLEIAEFQSKAVFWSDTLGQICGVIVSLFCIGGAIWLAMNNKMEVAIALAAIPTAAVIKAFFTSRHPSDKPEKTPDKGK